MGIILGLLLAFVLLIIGLKIIAKFNAPKTKTHEGFTGVRRGREGFGSNYY